MANKGIDEYTVNQYHLLDLGLFVSCLILLSTCFFYGSNFLYDIGLKNEWYILYLDKFSSAFSNTNDLKPKLLIVLFAAMYLYGINGNVPMEINLKQKVLVPLILGIPSFFGAFYFMIRMDKTTGGLVYILSTLLGFFLFFRGLTNYIKWRRMTKKRIKDRIKLDENVIKFNERKIVNNESINIPFAHSWFNLLNVYAGTMIIGNPGTGKTAIFGKEVLTQLIAKAFTGVIYDFKEGRESEFCAQIYTHYYEQIRGIQDKKKQPMLQFFTFDIKDPEKSVRINPIAPKTLNSIEECIDAASDFYANLLTKAAVKNKGEFFNESGKLAICNALTFLRYSALETKKDKDGNSLMGNCCTIPHLITFLSKMDDDAYNILRRKPETQFLFGAFTDALDNGAGNQLSGQFASGKLPFTFLGTPNIFWALSGEDITLDLNNPNDPKLLTLVTGESARESYAPIMGMILCRIAKIMNTRDRNPSMFYVDELATVFLRTLDNLIATGRENKIATFLVFQDYSQLVRDYGKEMSDVIVNVVANVVTGRVKGESAKRMQDWIGKRLKEKVSVTSRSAGADHTLSSQMEYAIPESTISNLHNFEFVGLLADGANISEQQDEIVFKDEMFLSDKEKDKFFKNRYLNLSRGESIRPQFSDFGDTQSNPELIHNAIIHNFEKIQKEVEDLINQEYERLLDSAQEKNVPDNQPPQQPIRFSSLN